MDRLDVFKRLSPQSLAVLRKLNPKLEEIEDINPAEFITSASELEPELLIVLKDLKYPNKYGQKRIPVKHWLIDAYYEAYISDSQSIEVHHLIFAYLQNYDSEYYYKAKKIYFQSTGLNIASRFKDYYQDISEFAIDQKFVGRNKEITRLMVSLSADLSKPPLIVGDKGSGKTALVYRLAQLIREGNVPDRIKNATIIRIDTSSVFNLMPLDMGVSPQIVFNHLLSSIAMANKSSAGKTILFLDNLNVSSGYFIGFEKHPSADILLVGAVRDDYQGKIWESSLYKLWDVVTLEDQNDEEYLEILENYSKDKFKGRVKFAKNSLEKIIENHHGDVTLEALPGGAIKSMEMLAVYKKHIESSSSSSQVVTVTLDDVSSFFDGQSGNFKADSLDKTDKSKLLTIEDELKVKIIGQDEAIKALGRALRVSSLKLHSTTKPVGTLLFLGPTGVGKTETAKALAGVLYGYHDVSKHRPNKFLRLDMAEYSEKHTVSKLFGAPPGYIGYDDASALADFVSENPECVILFDEIDKAHPEVLNSLLHIMEEAEIRSNSGEIISFENVIIIMTSNHGAELINKSDMGFSGYLNLGNENLANQVEIEKRLIKNLKKQLKPEFINRFDNIIVFRQLQNEDLLTILGLMLDPIIKSLKERGIKLKMVKAVEAKIVNESSCKEYGARELRRVMNKELIDPLSKILLGRKAVSEIKVSIVKKDIHFDVKK